MQKVLKLIVGIMAMGIISIQSVFAQAICPDFTTLLVDCTDSTQPVCFNDGVSITTFSGDDDFALSNLSLVTLAEEGAITLQTDSANFVVFGASTLSLLDEPFATLTVTLNARGRLRSTPNSTNDLNVVSAVDAGNTLVAYGRNERGDWVRVLFEDDAAWVATAVLNRAEFNNLPIVADDASAPAQPLNNFVITTQSPCAGMLIQTTIDTPVEFIINNLTLSLGSTALINATEEIFSLTLLEGVATLSVDEESDPLLLVEGTQAVVNVTDTFGEVVSPELLSPSAVSAITTLPIAITPAPSVPSQNIAQAVTQTFAPNGIANGRWRGVITSREGGAQVCRNLRPQDVYVTAMTATANSIDGLYTRSGANTYVFVDNRDWGDGSGSSFTSNRMVETPFSMQEAITYIHTTQQGQTYTCRYQVTWSYIGR